MKTFLNDKDLLKALKIGVWTKIKDLDEEYTHYQVIDFNSNELLICKSKVNWYSGETYHYPHEISQRGKNDTWFFENPNLNEKEEIDYIKKNGLRNETENT